MSAFLIPGVSVESTHKQHFAAGGFAFAKEVFLQRSLHRLDGGSGDSRGDDVLQRLVVQAQDLQRIRRVNRQGRSRWTAIPLTCGRPAIYRTGSSRRLCQRIGIVSAPIRCKAFRSPSMVGIPVP